MELSESFYQLTLLYHFIFPIITILS